METVDNDRDSVGGRMQPQVKGCSLSAAGKDVLNRAYCLVPGDRLTLDLSPADTDAMFKVWLPRFMTFGSSGTDPKKGRQEAHVVCDPDESSFSLVFYRDALTSPYVQVCRSCDEAGTLIMGLVPSGSLQ